MVRPALSELRDINITYTPCAGPMTPSSDDRTSAVYAYCSVRQHGYGYIMPRYSVSRALTGGGRELNAKHP
jgi:hypothetical protein